MDDYLTLSVETFSQALSAIKVCWQQVASTLADIFDPLVEDLVEFMENYELLWDPKESFPKPPRRLSNKSYLVDKRSQIRQYSYFRR